MEKVFVACLNADEEVSQEGLATLREIAIQQYEHVEFYFEKLKEVTAMGMQSESSRIGAQAFEFWTTLAEVEIDRLSNGLPIKGYVAGCKAQLLSQVNQGLLNITFEEDQDDDEWGHALSAACCLQKLAQLLKNEVIVEVVAFVTQHITQESWKNKYAALMALGSITEGPERGQFQQVIVGAFQNLLNMFADPSAKVREAISWVMCRISEHHADIFQDDGIIK
jgi:hypothetical protein